MLTIRERVRKIIADTLIVSLETMDDDSNLTTDFHLEDELDLIMLRMNLIDEFGRDISEKDFESLSKGTIGDIIKYIRKHAGEV